MSSTAKIAFDALVALSKSQQTIIAGRAAFQNCYWTLQQTNAKIQALVDAGDLTGVDQNLLTALSNFWNAIKAAQNTIEADPGFDVLR